MMNNNFTIFKKNFNEDTSERDRIFFDKLDKLKDKGHDILAYTYERNCAFPIIEWVDYEYPSRTMVSYYDNTPATSNCHILSFSNKENKFYVIQGIICEEKGCNSCGWEPGYGHKYLKKLRTKSTDELDIAIQEFIENAFNYFNWTCESFQYKILEPKDKEIWAGENVVIMHKDEEFLIDMSNKDKNNYFLRYGNHIFKLNDGSMTHALYVKNMDILMKSLDFFSKLFVEKYEDEEVSYDYDENFFVSEDSEDSGFGLFDE